MYIVYPGYFSSIQAITSISPIFHNHLVIVLRADLHNLTYSQIHSRAPLVVGASCTLQRFFSAQRNISPFRPKQKLTTPPGTRILPMRPPPSFQTSTPSPHPAYTFPYISHLMPSGVPDAAYAKTRRFVRNGAPPCNITSKA